VAASVSGSIAAGTNPVAVAVDSVSNKIYVANFGADGNNGICQTCYCAGLNGTLTVIDGATQSQTTSGFTYAYQNPLDLAVNPANHMAYVTSRVFQRPTNPTCGYGGELEAFAGGTLSQTTTAPYPSHTATASENLAVNQKTGNVYWSDWYGSSVAVLDASGNLVNTITLPTRPIGMAVNATTNKIYVATDECPTCTDPSSNDIVVIDGATNSVLSIISDPQVVAPAAIALNPTTNTIYVANGQSCSTCPIANTIVVIDGASDSVTGTVTVGYNPSAIAVDAQTNFIYVSNVERNAGAPGSVTVINGATNATATLTDPSLVDPHRIAVNPTTNKIYVADNGSNSVTVIDGAHE